MSTANPRALVIIGAGGFGAEVRDYAEASGWTVRGFLDDTKPIGLDAGIGGAILGSIDGYAANAGERFVIAIGDPVARSKIAQRRTDFEWATVVHPSAVVSPSATLEPGTVVGPFVYVGPRARVGPHVVLNTHVSCGHDATLAEFAVVCPSASIGGGASLGVRSFLGAQAVVTPRRSVGARARVAAGAVVFSDVPEGAEALGNPARWRGSAP